MWYRPSWNTKFLCYNFSLQFFRMAGVKVIRCRVSLVLGFKKYSRLAVPPVASLLLLLNGCKGFFVNQPSSVTITPNSPTLSSAQQQSFIAQAAFSDNTTKIVTASATWSTSNPCIIAMITSGTNAGNATDVGSGGSATITASYAGVIGT